ncbi:hypothetical protein T265_12319 [Opisthorchis viverrini]|uniref:Uncharacterized protein n=1 Tax=Opisthorchis viverrini TaxID=6198 RepID=A0A074YYM7_OPIVI|nr:hypothetical protein T265_12319 [Opisthorchis viverrini]KER18297.1 hypothetical protein T265_12319 [Opisthorchis viverrini]
MVRHLRPSELRCLAEKCIIAVKSDVECLGLRCSPGPYLQTLLWSAVVELATRDICEANSSAYRRTMSSAQAGMQPSPLG